MVRTAVKGDVAIDHVRDLLGQGRTEEALELVNQRDDRSDAWRNARGVCLMRLGLYEQAGHVLSAIVFPGGSVCVPSGIPALYRANFATAMLLMLRMDGAMGILMNLEGEEEPYVERLLAAVHTWKDGLTLPQRVALAVGCCPKKRVPMDFAPGGI